MVESSKKFIATYKDLEVYKRAYAIALVIHKESGNFPKEELFGLTAQARRASKSICANIAEGFAKQSSSSAEFGRFLSMALGSANEMSVWVSFMVDLGYITKETHNNWQQEYDVIARMINKLKNNSK